MAREVYNGIPLAPQIIERIKTAVNDCPNIYFGTPDYPIPPVACGVPDCKLLEEGCKRMPGAKPLSAVIQRAMGFVVRERVDSPKRSS